MSVYAFEDTIAYHVIFAIFFIAMLILFGLSILSIYRQRYIVGDLRKLDIVRYIVAWCLLVQFFTFLGYYIANVPLFAALWNVWIPSWSIGYILLSLNISIIHSSKLCKKRDDKKEIIKWRIIWCLWAGCSLSEWTASICGWFLGFYNIQAIGYLLWKFNAFIMLVLLMMILYDVYKDIQNVLQLSANIDRNFDNNVRDIHRALNRIKHLIVVELILSIYLFISVVYESYVIISMFSGMVIENVYVRQAALMKMMVYFPLWSLINGVLLVYGWIPNTTISKSEVAVAENVKMQQNPAKMVEMQQTPVKTAEMIQNPSNTISQVSSNVPSIAEIV